MLWREDSEGRELCHTGNKVYRRMPRVYVGF